MAATERRWRLKPRLEALGHKVCLRGLKQVRSLPGQGGSQLRPPSWPQALSGECIRRIRALRDLQLLLLRWLILLALGLLALPLYINIRQVGDTFVVHPTVLGWPLFGVTATCVVACWLVLQTAPAAGRWSRWIELGLILALGLAARAVFWPVPPIISRDAYRYVWDAHLLAHGVSPYTHTPLDPAVQWLRDQNIWPNQRFRTAPTIYPPGAEMLYLLIYIIKPLSIEALKAGIEVCDGLVAALMLFLLRRHRLDLRRVIIYWWSPIPIIEFAFSAHLDAAAIVWLLAAVLVAGQTWTGARGITGMLLGMATLTKFYPALYALPLLRRRRDWLLVLGLVGTVALGYLAFWPYQAQSGGFLSDYVHQSSSDRGILLHWLGIVVADLGGSEPLLIAAQVLALGALSLLVAWVCWRRELRPEAGVLAISVVWVILATHLFPWYVAVLLPFLGLYLRLPGLVRRAVPRRPADLSGHFASPAQGIWLFTLLMPFTYVIFPGSAAHPQLFPYFFYLSCALAALPLLTRQGRETLRAWLHSSLASAMRRPATTALMKEDTYADQPQPNSGQPAEHSDGTRCPIGAAAPRTVSGDDESV